jgi:hypothetical protein
MSRAQDLEQRLTELVNRLGHEFADLGDELRWSMTRALIHQGVHYATERPGVTYCALSTYLAEMTIHAHKLSHGDSPQSPTHHDITH